MNFIAPTEELELSIVNFATSINIPFGEFWYKWFKSHKNDNNTVHLECNINNLEEIITKEFSKLLFVEKLFEVKKISLPEYCEYKFQYYIHFKIKNNG